MAEKTKKKTSLATAVFSGVIGNTLEWFDYGLYGYFATIIAADFFVSDDRIVGLLLSFMTFAIGFLVRPIGGLLVGAYADKHGRIKALTVTILCMGICTFLMGCLPTYHQIGVAAPLLLVILRLLQGLSTGGEFGSSLTFIAEYGNQNNRAFLVSWQPFSVGIGLLIGSTCGLILTTVLPEQALYDWGWRIPFWFGILIAFYGVHLRKNVSDTPVFQKKQEEMRASGEKVSLAKSIADLFLHHKIAMLTTFGLLCGASCTYYLLITYMPTFISEFMGETLNAGFYVNTSCILIYLIFCPLMGKLIDKIGRRKGVIISSVLFIVLSYPIFSLVLQMTNPTLMIPLIGILIVIQSLLAVSNACASTEVFPTSLRNSGVGFSYNLAAAIFGGLAPLIATALIASTGEPVSISYLFIGSILITLIVGIFLMKRFYLKNKNGDWE